MDAIDRAIAEIHAKMPGSFAQADEASVDAGARALLDLPQDLALQWIARTIYGRRPIAPRSPSDMLADVRALIDDIEGQPVHPIAWHTVRQRKLALKECRRALVTMVHDAAADRIADRRAA